MPIRRPITFICPEAVSVPKPFTPQIRQNRRIRHEERRQFAFFGHVQCELHVKPNYDITSCRGSRRWFFHFTFGHFNRRPIAPQTKLGKRFNDTIREKTLVGEVCSWKGYCYDDTTRAVLSGTSSRPRENSYAKKQKLHFSCRCTFHVSFLFHLSNFLSYSHINLQQYIRWIRLESSSVVVWIYCD